VLLLLNGAPAVGKSALARRYAEEHPLALVVEVDDLRRQLGQWRHLEESKPMARDLAVALTRAHLRAGHDVIVPQFLGRREFVERLANVAREAGTFLLEVALTDDSDRIVERFCRRRAEFAATGVHHPEADLTDEQVDANIRSADELLRGLARARDLPLIDLGSGLEAGYVTLQHAVEVRRAQPT
jgi:predicted kinase